MRQLYTYTVADTKTGDIVLKDRSSAEVKQEIGLMSEKISIYATEGYLWRHRYRITRTKIVKPQEQTKSDFMVKAFNSYDREIMVIFDNAMEYLREHYSPSRLRAIVFVEKVERVS